MKVIINPSQLAFPHVTVPPSKSLAHRAVICAALAKGVSRIDNIDYSVDIKATLAAMEVLGAKVFYGEDFVLIEGIDSIQQDHELHVDCQESGSTLRFLIPLFSMCAKRTVFTGKGRLMQRPQSVYEHLFENANSPLKRTDHQLVVEGSIRPGEIHLRGDVSSQFISGLMFALPLCDQDSKLVIEGPFESRSYVDLTIEMLKHYGISVEIKNREILIPGNQKYCNADIRVEGDYSQLAFYASLGVLKGPLFTHGLTLDSKQGDRAIVHMLKMMNGQVKEIEDGYCFDTSDLKGTVLDLADCPDLGPALMMIASFAEGETIIIHAGRLRIKESDRIQAMETELKKCGVNIRSNEDTIWIEGKTQWQIQDALHGHNDHRIVMAMTIGAIASHQTAVIEGAEAISKSYPGFFDDVRKLGVDVHAE